MKTFNENVILKIGKSYKLRNGLTTSALRMAENGTNYIFEADVKETQHETKSVFSWLKNGSFVSITIEHNLDIMEQIN